MKYKFEINERLPGLNEYTKYNRTNRFAGASLKKKTEELEYDIKERDNNSIKDIDNLKRELKRDGLYSIQLEEFLEDYMKYYNK